MDIERFRDYCLAKRGVTECMPFDDESLVFKVMDKMFVLLDLSGRNWTNLKCDPERALDLRDRYPDITPAYHMNKKHWNTINLAGRLPDKLIFELIDHSYDLVVAKLTRKAKEELEGLGWKF